MDNTRLICGFHSVRSAMSSRSKFVRQLWYNETRKDKRMTTSVAVAKALGVDVMRVSNSNLVKMTGSSNQNIVATISKNSATSFDLKNSRLVLVLDGVTDVQNIGSCLRVAETAGVDVVITKVAPNIRAYDIISKTSSGASHFIPLVHTTNLRGTIRSLKGIGHTVIGSAHDAATTIYDAELRAPLVLVIGSEGEGMSRAVRRECDVLVRVPLWGRTPSLNVSVASGIMLFEIRRRW